MDGARCRVLACERDGELWSGDSERLAAVVILWSGVEGQGRQRGLQFAQPADAKTTRSTPGLTGDNGEVGGPEPMRS